MPIPRGNVRYSVGNEHSPTDPFGRAALLVEPGGNVRLDHFTLGDHAAWTGLVGADVLARLWAALDEDGFFELPRRPPPAGSAMRSVTVGDGPADARSVSIPYHATDTRPAQLVAIRLLEGIANQLGGDAIRGLTAVDEPLVSDVRRVMPGP